MAKSSKRHSQGSKPATNGAKPAADGAPAFNENALLALTEKIEKGFATDNKPQQKTHNHAQSKNNTKKGGSSDQHNLKNKTHAQEPRQGNKRDARGNRKPQNEDKAKGNKTKKPQTGNDKGDSDVLLQEILALGGTEEDLQLVADALSDDEELGGSNAPPPDKSFRADLAKFVAGLGIDAKIDDDASEPEAEQENEEWESSEIGRAHV